MMRAAKPMLLIVALSKVASALPRPVASPEVCALPLAYCSDHSLRQKGTHCPGWLPQDEANLLKEKLAQDTSMRPESKDKLMYLANTKVDWNEIHNASHEVWSRHSPSLSLPQSLTLHAALPARFASTGTQARRVHGKVGAGQGGACCS